METIGRYQIEQVIGKGAMGVVYRAYDPNIGRTVALKTMRLDVHGIENAEMLDRFRNEGRAAGVLNHPNLITVYDAGEHEGLFYLAMEFLEGETLQEWLARERAMPIDKVLLLMHQVCQGLDYAHSKGVIHRDIKPANIMISKTNPSLPGGDFTAKIMDFGIAKAGGSLTQTGQVLGTPNYMSPEQVRGKPLDGRSDLFSLGVVLYELLTGEKPFSAQNVTTIIYKIVNEAPIPPRELDVSIHPGISAVVTKALAKDPDERYQSGMELASALENYKSYGSEESATIQMSATMTSIDVGALAPPPVAPPISPLPTARQAARADTIEEKLKPELAATQASNLATVKANASLDATRKAAAPAVVADAVKDPTQGRSASAVVEEPKKTKALIYVIPALVVVLAAAGVVVRQQRGTQVEPARVETQQSVQTPPVQAPPTEITQTQAQPVATPTPPETKPVAVETTGELRILSKPSGASIILDGKAKGETPLTEKNLAPGKHKIELTLAGYERVQHPVEIKAGETAHVDLALAPSMGTVRISSVPAGADISIDGQPTRQQTPAEFTLSTGDHSFTLAKKGFEEAGDQITVAAGQAISLTPQLHAEQAVKNRRQMLAQEGKIGISVTTDPPGAWVSINGLRIGRSTPMTAPLPPGNYRLAIRKQGFAPIIRQITIEKDKQVVINERMKVKSGPED